MLNVDIVSQFYPAVAQELATLVEDCEACSARINRRMERARDCLQGKPSPTEEDSMATNQTS